MAANDTRASVICDAGPLIHLDELECLDLLADFAKVLVPEAVWAEVSKHRPAALQNTGVQLDRVPTPTPQDQGFRVLTHALALDAGEKAALALMQSYPTAIFLTDDAAARLAAEQLGLQVHGTVGIVLRAIRRRQRTPQEVVAVLSRIPTASTLHIRASLRFAQAQSGRRKEDYPTAHHMGRPLSRYGMPMTTGSARCSRRQPPRAQGQPATASRWK